MRIVIVADGRSPITHRWLQGLAALRHEVILISSFPCETLPEAVSTLTIPLAFAGMSGSQAGGKANLSQRKMRRMVSKARSMFMNARYVLGPLTLPSSGRKFHHLVKKLKPDLVHALRIPFEGMLASYTPKDIPLIVSVWGNDLTLHANGSPGMSSWTYRALRRADGLMADAYRDLRLGKTMGFSAERPQIRLPGGGGIDLVEINRARTEEVELPFSLPDKETPLVINPRGFRPNSVRNDIFFQALPLVRERYPNAQFWCAGMANQPEAQRWVNQLNLHDNVRLLPFMTQKQLWRIFWQADCSVSISSHDGTPNSLLEAMACGCFPVAGDIESLREWITPGINGFLVQPDNPQEAAEAILSAIQHPELRQSAAERNNQIIQEHADINLVRSQLQVFYQRFVQ